MTLLKTLAASTRKPSAIDQQLRAAREFIRAFRAAEYRIQIVDRVDERGKRNIEPVTAAELLEHVSNGTLARANVNHSCIFARPLRRDLLLIDDLPPHAIPALKKEGLAPLAVIQSSQKKTNVVIRVPSIGNDDYRLHTLTQKIVVEHLIERGFSADLAAARDLQVWRLPGFSNQKRNKDGSLRYAPNFFAKCLSIDPEAVAQRGEEFAARARAIIDLENEDGVEAPSMTVSAGVSASSDGDADSRIIYAPGKYVAAVLLGVRSAGEGTRNARLYAAAYTLFRLHFGAAGDESALRFFDADFIDRALSNASSAAGLEEKEIASTIASAKRAAATKPVRPIIVGV
jgi:hypothetical protein